MIASRRIHVVNFSLYIMLNGMPLTYLAQIHIQKANGQTTFWVRAGDIK